MNLSPRWVEVFLDSPIEAVHWSQIGAYDATDHELMAYACAHKFVIMTHDLDFSAILAASGASIPSVVQIRSANVAPDEWGARILALLLEHEALFDSGALITVDTDRNRVRLLPLLR